MSAYLYRLHFEGPVHFGLAGIGLEAVEDRLSSDSLTSALVNAFALLMGPDGAGHLVSSLASQNPPFFLSSLFPFGPDPADPSHSVETLVRPLALPPAVEGTVLRRFAKDIKRIRYLHPADFLGWASDSPLKEDEIARLISRSEGLTDGWWKEETRPRVALDRESQNSAIWSQAAIWFRKEERSASGTVEKAGAGLYGIVRFQDESWKEHLEAAFRVLGDTGLGGERTYGLGLFRFGGFEVPSPEWMSVLTGERRRWVLLSLCYPAEDERWELAETLDAWDFAEKRGYIVSGRNTTGLKRKRVRMLVEGSVGRKPLRGAMVDVTPDDAEAMGIPHRVYRSGLAFVVPHGDGS